MTFEYDLTKIKAVHHGYVERVELCLTSRSGFGRCGIYPSTTRYPGDRPESVAEHTSGLITLVLEMNVQFPEIVPTSRLGRILRLANYHDAAERVIGDIADNGGRNDSSKDRQELNALATVILTEWPRRERRALLKDFCDFQTHSSPMAQLLYALDKTESPLRALQYELAGFPGSVFNDPCVTELDKFHASVVGTGNAADVWGYHVLDRTKCLDFLYFDLAYALLRVAFAEARGQENVPQWLHAHYYELRHEKMCKATNS